MSSKEDIRIEFDIFDGYANLYLVTYENGVANGRHAIELKVEDLPLRDRGFIDNIVSMSKDLMSTYGNNKNDRG